MKAISFEPDFEHWQEAARGALRAGLTPDQIAWSPSHAEATLDLFEPAFALNSQAPLAIRVPQKLIPLARIVALHSSDTKWGLLYRVLWRVSHGEPKLLEIPTEPDVIALHHLAREVEKDAYRMRQYIRFREAKWNDQNWFVAWYEPEHQSVHLNEKFFTDRFANMRWAILTPKQCMYWDGESIRHGAGVTRASAPTEDEVESLWVTYYSSIFNPARVKVSAMKAQMPVRNWKNLPEGRAIAPLLASAPLRVNTMLERSEFFRERESDYTLARPPQTRDWAVLRDSAAHCQACPLWKTATCTVFGEGPQNARVVLVGEQPGDAEDRAGRPFVGPAGQLLDRALAEAGVSRADIYLTNAVKHFKFEPRGKRRIHQTANARDVMACRPWLETELGLLKPNLIVALGATAARSLFKTTVRVTQERGRIINSEFGKTLVTIHPSALLRLPNKEDFEPELARFISDLSQIRGAG